MNRSDLRPEGRALTVAVALVVAVAGLGLAVLALRDQSASRRTPDAQSSPTGAAAGRVNGLIAFGCGYRICTMVPDGTSVRDVMDGYDKGLVVAGYTPTRSPAEPRRGRQSGRRTARCWRSRATTARPTGCTS